MKKSVLILLFILMVSSFCGCITDESVVLDDAASLSLLANGAITVDGKDLDWSDEALIYKDSEKSLHVARNGESIVFGVYYVDLEPSEETYNFALDTDFDEVENYLIEIGAGGATLSERTDDGWEILDAGVESAVRYIVEFSVPEDVIGNGFYFTGWVHNEEYDVDTAHFPWVRSLLPDGTFDAEALTTSDYLEDFEALYYIMMYNYPYLSYVETTYGYDWLELMEERMDQAGSCQSNEEFFDMLLEAKNTLQNLHTSILTYSSFEYYGRDVLSFDDTIIEASKYWDPMLSYTPCYPDILFRHVGNAYVAVSGVSGWEELYGVEKGTKVLGVDGTQINEAVGSLAESTLLYYEASSDTPFLKYLYPSYFGADAVYELELPDGTILKTQIAYSLEGDFYTMYSDYFGDDDSNLTLELWKDRGVAYMKINSFSETLDGDLPSLLQFYKDITDYDALIIDVRNNGGGDFYEYCIANIVNPLTSEDLRFDVDRACTMGKYSEWTFPYYSAQQMDFIANDTAAGGYRIVPDTITATPTGSTPFDGDIYLLVDNYSGSASDLFAAFCKATGFATVVGDETCGGGFERMGLFVLPNSKIVIRTTIARESDTDGTMPTIINTVPDIFVNETYCEDEDIILQYVLDNLV